MIKTHVRHAMLLIIPNDVSHRTAARTPINTPPSTFPSTSGLIAAAFEVDAEGAAEVKAAAVPEADVPVVVGEATLLGVAVEDEETVYTSVRKEAANRHHATVPTERVDDEEIVPLAERTVGTALNVLTLVETAELKVMTIAGVEVVSCTVTVDVGLNATIVEYNVLDTRDILPVDVVCGTKFPAATLATIAEPRVGRAGDPSTCHPPAVAAGQETVAEDGL